MSWVSQARCTLGPMLSLVTSLVLAGQFVVGPVLPMPTELEVCILTAEVCSLETMLPICGAWPETVSSTCISNFENCSYDFAEAHEASCRMDYVWCKLEGSAGSGEDYLKFCGEVFETCPSQA